MNGGETAISLQTKQLTWISPTFLTSLVKIEYSKDNGVSWDLIVNSTTNTGTYNWVVPTVSTAYNNSRIRISDVNKPSVFDISDNTFILKPAIELISPNNNNGLWGACTSSSITWNAGISTNYKIDYSTDNGINWITENANYANSTSYVVYNWTVPSIPSTTYLVRVSDLNNANYFDISQSYFTVSPAITLTYPSYGGVVQVGSVVPIQWTSYNTTSYYKLDYSNNNGLSWTNIVTNYYSTTGTYNWTVPNDISTLCKIRVSDYNSSCKTDASDNPFSIAASTSPVTLNNLNSGNLNGCSQTNINFSAGTGVTSVNIYYSLDDGVSWTTIVSSLNASLSNYNWTVPNISTTQLLIRVVDANNPSNYDVSNNLLTITPTISPVISTTGSLTFCNGDSIVLRSNYPTGNIWNTGSQLDSIIVKTSGTYYLNNTQGTCLATSNSLVVTVNPRPTTPVISASGLLNICQGQSVLLTSSSTISNTWFPNRETTQTITVSQTGSYAVIVSNQYGCTSSSQYINVNVIPLPEAPILSYNSPVYEGGVLQLTANNGSSFTYHWTGPNSYSSNVYNPSINNLNSLNSGVYLCSLTSNGCTGPTSSLTIPVLPNPIQVIYPNGSEHLQACSNNNISWNNNGTSGVFNIYVSYNNGTTWTTIASNYQSNAAIVTYIWNANIASSTNCLIKVSDAINSNIWDVSNAVFEIQNNVNLTVSAPITICSGFNTQLTAGGATTYSWSPTTGLSNALIANPVANPTITTTYTVTGTTSGCSSTASVTVTVNPIPNVTVSGAATICSGANTTITANGGTTYSWSPATGLSNASIANPTANPTTTTTYTVTGTTNGCSDTANVTITVNPIPNVTASGTATICSGNNTSISASGATTYSWSPSIGLSNNLISNPIANPTTNTTYTVTGTTNGCSNTASVTITVNQLINLVASGTTTICAGDGTSISASGASSYSWSPSTGLSNNLIANPIASPTTTTTYIVTGTTNGCSNTANVTITVNQIPNVLANGTASICSGSGTTLSASGATTYSWYPATGLNSTISASPTASPTTTTTYTVTGVINGCSKTANVTVTVNPVPSITAGGAATICEGTNTSLSASGATSYSWSPATSLNDSHIANPIANPTTTTTYTVTGTTNGCSSTADVIVTVNSVTLNISNPSTLCFGGSTQLSATGATSYEWLPVTALNDPHISNPIASPTSTTTYTVTGTKNGCSKSSSVTLTVSPVPNVVATGSTSICAGSSTLISASGANSYSWSPATGLSSTTSATPTANPTVTTTYTVTGSNNGCGNTATVTITVNPIPSLTANGAATICAGSNTPLIASGATTYSWSPATGLSNVSIANPSANPTTTTTYTVTGITNGCSSTANVTVTVNPIPNVVANGAATICSGSGTNLSVSGATTYSWLPSTGLNSTTSTNPTANPTTTTTYTVTGTANGCSNSTTVTVTVNPAPSVTASGTTTICAGSGAPLLASGANTYSWSPAIGLSNNLIANPTASPATTTTYIVTGTTNGCSNTASVTITVNPIPNVIATGTTTMCAGNGTGISASGATTYSWSPASGLNSTTSANPSANPTSTTTYTVTGTTNGCSNTANVTVTVNPIPTITAGGTATICEGINTSLSATGATSYSWSPATGLNDSHISNPIASPTTTTTYTVTGTTNGCSNSANVTVIVNSISLNTSSPSTICLGSSMQLSATGATSYDWLPTTGLSDPHVANPIASPSISTTYTVTGTLNGCSKSASVALTVSTVPNVIANGAATICAGSSAALSASGATSYSWSPATGLSSTTSATPTANPTSTTTYTVTGSNNGCGNTASVTITVNPIPTITANGAATICSGSTTPLLASGASSYSWSPSTALNNNSIADPVANPTTTTTYTVTGTTNGCSNTANVTLTVNAIPNVSASGTTTICNGTNTAISASGATTYNWSPATGLNSTTLANPTANPSSTTTYTVTGTTNGCSNTANVTITVNPVPTVIANGTTTICAGSSTPLLASGATTYNWSPAVGLSNALIANPTANPTTTTTYIVTGTTNACSNTASVTITVNQMPNVIASGTTAICEGSSTAIAASGATNYNWTPATGLNSTTSANPSANPTTTTTYTVTGTTNGCSNTANVTITVNPIPIISAEGTATICEGLNTPLSASGGTTYNWTPSTGLSDSHIANPTASPTTTTTYTVTGTTNNCSNTANITVTVNPLPANAGPVTGASSVCQKDHSETYNVPLINNASSYFWTLPTGATGTSTTNSIIIDFSATAASGNIIVKGVNSCGIGVGSSLALTVNPLPVTPVITAVGSLLHSNMPTGNQWYNQNGVINGATNQDYNVISNGIYYVTTTVFSCTSDTSNNLNINLTGIDQQDNTTTARIYPNPITDKLTIELTANNKIINYDITNALGQVVNKGSFTNKIIIPTATYTPGIYIIKLNDGKTINYHKIIKN